LTAVAGYRGAGTGPLFLEQYLDQPIEDCIWTKFTPPAERHEIVELGGFAAINHRAALPLVMHLAPALYELRFKKLVCTANRLIHQHALRKPDDPAISDGETSLTYGQLSESVNTFAG